MVVKKSWQSAGFEMLSFSAVDCFNQHFVLYLEFCAIIRAVCEIRMEECMEMSVFNRFILCLIRNVEKTIKNMTAEKFVTNCI